MRKNLLLIAMFALVSCDVSEPEYEAMKSRAKEIPEVKSLLVAFKEQKHRIELNGCDMFYNGVPFNVRMSIREITSIFGAYDLFDRERGLYGWSDAGLFFQTERGEKESEDSNVRYFIIKLRDRNNAGKNDVEDMLSVFNGGYLLVEGVPVTKNTPFKDFVARSNFQLSDFYIDNYSYELHYKCGSTKKLVYLLAAKGGWLYKGTGHLMMKSEPNPDNKSIIDAINVFESKE